MCIGHIRSYYIHCGLPLSITSPVDPTFCDCAEPSFGFKAIRRHVESRVNLPSLGPGAKSPGLGVFIVRGIPKMDDLFHGKSQSQMDDLKVPPLKWNLHMSSLRWYPGKFHGKSSSNHSSHPLLSGETSVKISPKVILTAPENRILLEGRSRWNFSPQTPGIRLDHHQTMGRLSTGKHHKPKTPRASPGNPSRVLGSSWLNIEW